MAIVANLKSRIEALKRRKNTALRTAENLEAEIKTEEIALETALKEPVPEPRPVGRPRKLKYLEIQNLNNERGFFAIAGSVEKAPQHGGGRRPWTDKELVTQYKEYLAAHPLTKADTDD